MFGNSASGTGFSFGATPAKTSTSAPTFGFPSASTTSTSALAKPTFSFPGPTTSSATGTTGLFGGTSTASGTGSLFGGAAGTTGTGLFAKPVTGATTGGLFSNTSTQLNTAQQKTELKDEFSVLKAVHTPVVFNDERDSILTRWNQLQAFWGVGKGYFSQTEAASFTPENQYCLFKAVGYTLMPETNDDQGLVALIVKKKLSDIQANQQASVTFLTQLIGNISTITVCVESLRALPDNYTEMVIYLQERQNNGTVSRVSASKLYQFLTQSDKNTQLKSAGVEQVIPRVSFDKNTLKTYLSNPPQGVDRLLWEQAKKDNPNSDKLIPVPMVGFNELNSRLKHQEQQTSAQQNRLDIIQTTLTTLQQDQATTASRIHSLRRKHLELGHRVLKVAVAQEIHRKMGYGIMAHEEELRTRLEQIQHELNSPTQYKSRLNELLSQIHLQSGINSTPSIGTYNNAVMDVEDDFLTEIKAHLQQQQSGLSELISLIKQDLSDLRLIETSYRESNTVQVEGR